ncbi:MAG: CPBP family intramembrane glutamic endopeptidase [Planctomycetota bacterium]
MRGPERTAGVPPAFVLAPCQPATSGRDARGTFADMHPSDPATALYSGAIPSIIPPLSRWKGLLVVESVYSNGLRHPPLALRVRIAVELGVLVAGAILLLIFLPRHMRNTATYVGLALAALGLIGFTARETKERIWGPPESPDFDRVRRCAIGMTFFTAPPLFLFLVLGVAMRYWGFWLPPHHCPILTLNFPLAVVCYLPWALLQQTLFQFYLLGRLRALLPFASPLLLSMLNGLFYGLVHLPNVPVTLVTIIGGMFWSYSYHRDRYVLPIALSHALLGSTFYYWVLCRDLVAEMSGH